MSAFEILGTILGVIGVGLMIRQNVWGWPVGIVQVAVYAWVFFTAKLYSDALLQVCFFAIQAYGWWHWLRGGVERAAAESESSGAVRRETEAHAVLPVTRLRVQAVLGWSVAGALATAGWGELMRRHTDAALPHWDAFILMFSLIAQWLQARKRLECWAGWMIVNVVAVGVYWAKDLRLTAGLYVVFFAMAVAGHLAWRRTMKATSGGIRTKEAAA
jgi:nicotinamide mononucleotide transporter